MLAERLLGGKTVSLQNLDSRGGRSKRGMRHASRGR
jgi:hypothetical protein